MAITRLEAITYGVEDVAACTRYFEDFGLEVVECGASGASFRTQEHQWVNVRGTTDTGLPKAIEPGSTLREAVWGVDTAANLKALSADLARDREVRTSTDGSLHTLDDAGLPVGFAIARPAPLQRGAPLVNAGHSTARVNRPVDEITKVWPMRIIHVVYDVPQAHWQSYSDFYLKRLGFRLSDRSMNAGDFMRCSMDHHNLFLLNRNNKLGYNHVAFEVRDIDEIMLGGLHMKKQGWKAVRHPGRHFLGSNLHWFFDSPSGGRVEYLADMDRLDDTWTPRVWEKHPGQSIWLANVD